MRITNHAAACYVDVDASTQSATVRNVSDDRPIATLQRRRVLAQGPEWRLYDTAGLEVGSGFPRASLALRQIADLRSTF